MIKHLEVGSVLAATFIDGIEETPHVVGTLKLDDERGVRVFIPFVLGSKECQAPGLMEARLDPFHRGDGGQV